MVIGTLILIVYTTRLFLPGYTLSNLSCVFLCLFFCRVFLLFAAIPFTYKPSVAPITSSDLSFHPAGACDLDMRPKPDLRQAVQVLVAEEMLTCNFG